MLCNMLGKFISHDSDCHGKFRSPQNSQFAGLKMAECGFHTHTLSLSHTEKKVLLSPCILHGTEMDIKLQCNYSLFWACAVFPQTIQYFAISWQKYFANGVNDEVAHPRTETSYCHAFLTICFFYKLQC
jgi:hypothetical protein